MTRIRKLHEKWMQDPEYRSEYDALGEEFSMASTLIRVRTEAGLTQDELARPMNTEKRS